MKRTLPILFLLASVCLADDTRTEPVKLLWDYTPPDSLTNYVFMVRSSTNAAAPLPWPVVVAVTGELGCTLSIDLTPQPKFYYVTVTDSRSCPTNYIAESDPSNVAQVRLLKRGGLSIVKGP